MRKLNIINFLLFFITVIGSSQTLVYVTETKTKESIDFVIVDNMYNADVWANLTTKTGQHEWINWKIIDNKSRADIIVRFVDNCNDCRTVYFFGIRKPFKSNIPKNKRYK
jgi:hypothetical protein